MLAVIDYGAGNLRSVLHALSHLGTENVRLVQSPDDLEDADKIILPGVGAFGAGMQQLHAQKLVEPIREAVNSGVPYLGICLGMQFLFEESDEMGQHQGIGLLPGKVTRFSNQPGRKVPHMGWNQLRVCKPTALFDNISNDDYAYFVHSYFCVPQNENDTAAVVDYGESFTVAVQRDNIYGVQFHPEKSQRTGLQLLTNFLRL
jgi:imidazole glycerol-phosphate synthase subunit HisH